jgi:hypothetical protein
MSSWEILGNGKTDGKRTGKKRETFRNNVEKTIVTNCYKSFWDSELTNVLWRVSPSFSRLDFP